MKKNRMMRLASGLLVAVLITTSMISGTFAKYVTTAEGTDKARVAKWGVEVAVEGADLFVNKYETNNETVVSSVETEDVVAPGTKNDTGIKFTLKGQPEVDVNVNVTLTAEDGTSDLKEVFLAKGSYADMTTGNDEEDSFTVDENYYPVVFTLKSEAGAVLASGKLADIETYFEETITDTYEANTNLANIATGTDGTYVLTWEWKYSDVNFDVISDNDRKDTLLGDLAADSTLLAKGATAPFEKLVEGADYCNDIEFKVAITVTQID